MMPWRLVAGLILIGAIITAGAIYREHVWRAGYDQATSERTAADLRAVINRTADNAVLLTKQETINAAITKAHDEEIAPVRARIDAKRVRVGPALCGGPAAPAQAESAGSSVIPDPPRRLVRDDLDQAFRALMMDVENDLATGRACQAFIKENGFAP